MSEVVVFIVGLIIGIIGGVLLYNGWTTDPHHWGMVVGGGVMVIIGCIMSGWIIIMDL